MKTFLDKDFLLHSDTAAYLYHEHAAKMPVIDYHNHLVPKMMADNHRFENIAQALLYGDHYKWRAMRTNGIDEKYCTGNAGDREKFLKWAETVPYTLRNPLYHWTHMELQRYFNITELLNPSTADKIYNITTEMLQHNNYRVHGLLQKMNVEVVCTTDDPADSLEHHIKIKTSGAPFSVFPAWRPDKSMAVENVQAYNAYIDQLSAASDIEIGTFTALLEALRKRHAFFHANGCRVSDHGLDCFYAEKYTPGEVESAFLKIREGKELSADEIIKFKSAMLYEYAVMDFEKGWVQQYHLGPIRNNNSRMFAAIGADTGFDSIGDFKQAISMSRFLDRLDKEEKLAKTILYNINPSDNEVLATMLGNFQDGKTPGKIQWGSGWWFLDQKDGMERQLNTLSTLGLLSRFIGMLTDSRSFLSFPRHEYFRRILCNVIGTDVENGEIPNDMGLLGRMVEDICYYNAKNYFNF
ncbi:MAG: glucuronate isomerase [Bacteroidales bacterium]|nr:glucuronate isomerase [Bacteroidales bacterium]